MQDSIALLNQVSYIYPHTSDFALKDISLQINKGEFLGIIGATGAGKSTLCMMLNGIIPQFYGGRFFGHVTTAGLDTIDHPISVLAQRVGIVFQDPETQITATSVENEIAFALENLRVPRDEIIARIPAVLEAVRLEGTEKKHPHELSGGQKQRLAIAAALALQTDILVLDEPTSQLDPAGAEEVFATVHELNTELGVTVVIASHAAEEMAQYADRVVLLAEGKIKLIATPPDIYSSVEALQALELRPPQVAQTFYLINKYGLYTPEIPVCLEKGIALIEETAIIQPDRPPIMTHIGRDKQQKNPLLSVRDLYYTYSDGTCALTGINLDIYDGEFILIAGQNGAGKSTLVKHFLKILEPGQGDVFVGQKNTRFQSVSELANRIGYVGQNPDHQIFNMTVKDEVSFALEHAGYSRKVIDTRVIDSLKAVGLLDKQDRHPFSLPKGDRARVVIAAVLAMQPEILILDEPTTGQDYRDAMDILEICRQLNALGKTIIIITHHLYLMPNYARRVIIMGKAKIILDAPIRQAFHNTDILKSTFLTPPQAVTLAQHLSKDQLIPLISPEEVAAYVTGQDIFSDPEQGLV